MRQKHFNVVSKSNVSSQGLRLGRKLIIMKQIADSKETPSNNLAQIV